MLFTCITGTLFPSTGHRSFDWAGPAWLAGSPVLTNQMAFTKCVSQCLNVPAPVALSILLNSPLYYMMRDRMYDIPVHTAWPRCLWGCFGKSRCLTQLFLGTCYRKTCFSRPKICFQPSSGFFHHCKHTTLMTLALVSLWEFDITHLPGLPRFILQPKRLYLFGWLQHMFHVSG